MTPVEVMDAAEAYLLFLLHGTQHARARALFPKIPEVAGIQLRQPANCGAPPEFNPSEVSEADQVLFDPHEGPEPCGQDYVFVDRCALTGVRFTRAGTALRVDFVAINDYPGNSFPLELAIPTKELEKRRVILPTSMGEHFGAAEECLERLQDFLGVELTSIDIEHTVTLFTKEEIE